MAQPAATAMQRWVGPTCMVASLEPLQNRRLGSARWAGSQARDVIHLLCPRQQPRALPVCGSHSQMQLSMPPLATICASGDQATHSTQFLCPCSKRC